MTKKLTDDIETKTLRINPMEMYGWDDYEMTVEDDGTIVLERLYTDDYGDEST